MKVKKIEVKNVCVCLNLECDGPYEVILVTKNGERFKLDCDAQRIDDDEDDSKRD